jgi:hypothetical protein
MCPNLLPTFKGFRHYPRWHHNQWFHFSLITSVVSSLRATRDGSESPMEGYMIFVAEPMPGSIRNAPEVAALFHQKTSVGHPVAQERDVPARMETDTMTTVEKDVGTANSEPHQLVQVKRAISPDARGRNMWTQQITEFMTIVGGHMPTKLPLEV